jgi:hypothetical protein
MGAPALEVELAVMLTGVLTAAFSRTLLAAPLMSTGVDTEWTGVGIGEPGTGGKGVPGGTPR